MKMLESRLEKQVLNEIEMLLSRNPNCMLTPHDVQVNITMDPIYIEKNRFFIDFLCSII